MLNHFSIKQIVQGKLRQLLNLSLKKSLNDDFSLNSIVVEIASKKFTSHISYKSPLCLQIAKFEEKKPAIIAEELIDLSNKLKIWAELDLQVNISDYGWLEFTIGDRLLINWLQQLPNITFPLYHDLSTKNQLDFELYYTHARCCSILRLAHRDKLIELKTLDFNESGWLWHQPELIPYDCGCLKLEFEKKLIHHLSIIVDGIYEQKEPNWLKTAYDFSKVILDFEGNCRIFGDLKRDYLKLSQVRLGLIALAQFYLRWILEKKLKAIAPIEL